MSGDKGFLFSTFLNLRKRRVSFKKSWKLKKQKNWGKIESTGLIWRLPGSEITTKQTMGCQIKY